MEGRSSISNIYNQRVLLKVDVDSIGQLKYKMTLIVETIKQLLSQGCAVCVFPSTGPAIMSPGRSCQFVGALLEEQLGVPVKWLDQSIHRKSLVLGQVSLLQNSFFDCRDVYCDKQYISELIAAVDVVVFNTLKHFHANYASTYGLRTSGVKTAFAPSIMNLSALKNMLSNKRVGLIAGGNMVAWQLKLIRSLMPSIGFLAVGGELAYTMMVGETTFGRLQNEILSVTQMIRHQHAKVVYPLDIVAYSSVSQRSRICLFQDLESCDEFHDLGPQSVKRVLQEVQALPLDVVVFSGVLGSYKDPRYARSSETVIKQLPLVHSNAVLLGGEAMIIAEKYGVLDLYQYAFEASEEEMSCLVSEKDMYLEQTVV